MSFTSDVEHRLDHASQLRIGLLARTPEQALHDCPAAKHRLVSPPPRDQYDAVGPGQQVAASS